MKNYIYIQSNIDIVVTSGMQNIDLTIKNSDLPNRIKVDPIWNKCKCLIKKGQHVYPSEIANWKTVRNLEKDGVLTLGAYTDEGDEEAVKVKNAIKDFKLKEATTSKKDTKNKTPKLSDASETGNENE